MQWYRAGSGTVTMATESAPASEDRIGEFFGQARLRLVAGAGHFAPLEYPGVIAEEVRAFLA